MAKIKKMWQTIIVATNNVSVDADFNYETKEYYISEPKQDRLVSFRSGNVKSIDENLEKAKCVTIALQYIKRELGI